MLSSVSISFGQTLDEHQWKDRVLLVNGNDSAKFNKQITLLKKDVLSLKDRKLIVYKIAPLMYQKGIESNHWISSKQWYIEFKKTKKPIEIILIGLDGGVKLHQTKLLNLEKLFTLIDGMPMRKAEIKKNK